MKLWHVVCIVVICGSFVHAQAIVLDQFAGTDQIRGLVKSNDTLTVDALVQIPGERVVDPSQVKLVLGGNAFRFDTCDSSDATTRTHRCILNHQLTGASGRIQAQVELFASGGTQPVKVVREWLTIDSAAPVISRLVVDPVASQTGVVTIHVEVDEDAGEQCQGSGINTVEVSGAGDAIDPIVSPKTNSRGQCSLQREIPFVVTQEGISSICARATDVFGHRSEPVCVEVRVDTTAPTIDEGSLFIGTQQGPLSYIGPRGTPAVISLVLRGDTVSGMHDINTDSIRADLSHLTRLVDTAVRPTRVYDVTGGVQVFFEDLVLHNVQPCQIEVYGEDNSIDGSGVGNQFRVMQSCSIQIDRTPPEVQSVVTDQGMLDDAHVFKAEGRVHVYFDESESGLDVNSMELQLGSYGQARQEYCEYVSDTWVCVWTYRLATRSLEQEPFTAVLSGRDKARNEMQRYQIPAVADNTKPSVHTSVTTIDLLDASGQKTENMVQGSTFTFTVPVQYATRASANLTPLGGDVVDATCTLSGTHGNCTFTGSVSLSGPYARTIELLFYDAAGNIHREYKRISVLGTSDNPDPNYWHGVTMECSPSQIDRASAALGTEKQVFCTMTMPVYQLSGGAPSIASIEIGNVPECTPEMTGWLQDVRLMNTQPGTTSPIAVITLNAVPFKINELNFTCPLKIISRVGNALMSNVEIENASFHFEFYNHELGTASKNIDEEVDDAIKKAKKMKGLLENGQKLLDLSTKLCQVRSTLWSALSTVDVTIAVLSDIGGALGIVAPGSDCMLDGVKKALCKTGDNLQTSLSQGFDGEGLAGFGSAIDKILKIYCNIVNCKYGIWTGVAKIGELADSDDAQEIFGQVDRWSSGDIYEVIPFSDSSTLTGGKQEELEPTEIHPGNFNVKDSLPLSIANLCLPGVVSNWEKWRQIQCEYAVCLGKDVVEDGVPIHVCRDERHYKQCVYVYKTVIFNSLPIVPLINYVKDTVATAISNPMSSVTLLSAAICHNFCGAVKEGTVTSAEGADQAGCEVINDAFFQFCQIPKLAAVIGDVMGDLEGVFDSESGLFDMGSESTDACSQMEQLAKEREEKEEEREVTPI